MSIQSAKSSTRSRALSALDVPVIDIGPLRDGSDPGKVADALAWAATDVGFIYVSNHGVDLELIEEARRSGLAFFRQSLELKRQVTVNAHHHGYLGPGGTKMYDDAKADLKESYNFGIELDESHSTATPSHMLLGRNEWPLAMPELRSAVYPFFKAATAAAEHLLGAFALAGGHASDTFTRTSDTPVSRGSLQYYPPRPADAADDHFSLAAHTDFGVLTVLAQDSIGGLQIRTPDGPDGKEGEWVSVPPVEGTLVVNVGDLLARWSNDTFRSTPHRVMNDSGQERLSLVLAYDPNPDTVVDPSLFCSDGEEPNYEPITCGDYLLWRFRRAFAYREE
ncbi:MAG: isopenicillin N synthase family oxygenase [Chromatiales bacterium]|nr:isopenicillin N synthase family oxygenase [Chromatiales bacterium]